MNKILRTKIIEPYIVRYNGVTLQPTFMIGRGHIYTLASRTADVEEPDEACVDMHLRDWSRCYEGDTSENFVIDSYYDESTARCRRSVVEHLLMFNVLKMMAFFSGVDRIELLDGSRKITSKGCPWNLRVMNRLMKGEESTTFYERFGFRACNDFLFVRQIRLAALKPFLSTETIVFFERSGWGTVKEVVLGMFALCNSDEYDGRYDEVQTNFVRAIDLHHRHNIGQTFDIEKAAMAYVFRFPPRMHELRPSINISPPTEESIGIIEITSSAEVNQLLKSSHTGGTSKRRNRKRASRRN